MNRKKKKKKKERRRNKNKESFYFPQFCDCQSKISHFTFHSGPAIWSDLPAISSLYDNLLRLSCLFFIITMTSLLPLSIACWCRYCGVECRGKKWEPTTDRAGKKKKKNLDYDNCVPQLLTIRVSKRKNPLGIWWLLMVLWAPAGVCLWALESSIIYCI